jgi:hypothetical protein
VELQGHVDCPSNFDEFLTMDQLIPTTDHTATSLDVPDSEHVAYEQEEASDADEKIVKAMDDIQDLVSKIYTQSLKQRAIDSYFKKQLPNIKFSRACICFFKCVKF